MKLNFVIFAAFAIVLWPFYAKAQMIINDNAFLQYQPSSNPYDDGSTPYQAIGSDSRIALVRLPDAAHNEFAIEFSYPTAINGCAGSGIYRAETNKRYRILEVQVEFLHLIPDPDNGIVCTTAPMTPVGHLVLKRDELMADDITDIHFFLGYDRNAYKIEVSENKVALFKPRHSNDRVTLFTPREIASRYNLLSHWFYPENSLLLWIPGADHNESYEKAISQFVMKHNLTPMNKVLRGFESPLKDKSYVYVVDRNDVFGDISGLERGTKIGHIMTEHEKYGLRGTETVMKEMPVFARKPSLYE